MGILAFLFSGSNISYLLYLVFLVLFILYHSIVNVGGDELATLERRWIGKEMP